MSAARAALLAAIKEPFVVEEIDYLEPEPGRVLLRTGASPFCSTDCVNWRGDLGKIPPTILGHASMGEVVEVGAGVTHIKVGQRAIVPGTSECGVCFYCAIGRPDQCSETFDRAGIWPHVADRRNGEPVSAAGNVGGYAEVMNVTANQVFPIESDLPDEWLCLLGCGITTGLGSVFNVAKVQAGASVAVVGLGHLGQWMVQAAKLAQARQIIAVDPIEYRRELAGRLGATELVDPGAEDSVARVKELTEGRGADYVLEAATLASAQTEAILMSRRAGTVVLTSVESATATVTVPQVAIAVQSRAILSAQNGNVRMRHDLPRFIRMLEDGLVTAEPIITRRYTLDRDQRCPSRLRRDARPERRHRPERLTMEPARRGTTRSAALRRDGARPRHRSWWSSRVPRCLFEGHSVASQHECRTRATAHLHALLPAPNRDPSQRRARTRRRRLPGVRSRGARGVPRPERGRLVGRAQVPGLLCIGLARARTALRLVYAARTAELRPTCSA